MSGLAVQKRNSERFDLQMADFQARYEPQFALGSMLSRYRMLPGLRGLWPASSVDENGDIFDASDQARTMSLNGGPLISDNNLFPEAQLDGTNDYYSRADEAGLDILGTETYIAAAARGLALGGWFYCDTIPATNNYGLIAKWRISLSNNRSYMLYIPNGIARPRFAVSSNGVAANSVTSSVSVTASTYFFVWAYFDPSAEIAINVNGEWDSSVAAIPASIFSSTANLYIGDYDNAAAANRLPGGYSIAALCASRLSRSIIDDLWQQDRPLYGL